MDKKTTGIVAYITWIGWIVAFLAGDKEGAKFQLNQTLVLWLVSIVNSFIIANIPLIGWISFIIGIFIFVCWIIGLIGACKDEEKEMPLIGQIKILK